MVRSRRIGGADIRGEATCRGQRNEAVTVRRTSARHPLAAQRLIEVLDRGRPGRCAALLEEYLKPAGIALVAHAAKVRVRIQRVNRIISGAGR